MKKSHPPFAAALEASEEVLVDVSPGDVTDLLQGWSTANATQRERLFELIYPELQRLARRQLVHEPADISIQATELVHEAYFRLVDQHRNHWASRAHFYSLAALTLRRVLVDHAKHKRRFKRGRHTIHLTLDEAMLPGEGLNLDLMAVDRALVELAAIGSTAARVVELRFFAGLSLDETSEVMGISRKTVQRKWQFARAWLMRKLSS